MDAPIFVFKGVRAKIISKLFYIVLERVKFGRNLKGVALVREPGRISRGAFECYGDMCFK